MYRTDKLLNENYWTELLYGLANEPRDPEVLDSCSEQTWSGEASVRCWWLVQASSYFTSLHTSHTYVLQPSSTFEATIRKRNYFGLWVVGVLTISLSSILAPTKSSKATLVQLPTLTLSSHNPSCQAWDGDRVVFGAKTWSFCSLTFDKVSIPPDCFPFLRHLLSSPLSFPLSFLSSLFVGALTRMRREPFKTSGNASRCLFSALGIDLFGQFVVPDVSQLMRSRAAKFWGGRSKKKRFFTISVQKIQLFTL